MSPQQARRRAITASGDSACRVRQVGVRDVGMGSVEGRITSAACHPETKMTASQKDGVFGIANATSRSSAGHDLWDGQCDKLTDRRGSRILWKD